MMTSKVLFQEVVTALSLIEDGGEAEAIAAVLLENVYGISRVDIMAGKAVPHNEEVAFMLQKHLKRIRSGEPVQYVVGEEVFFGRKFHVNPSVLIPRPETEDLIRVVISCCELQKANPATLRLLDIGTGSGCIPITLFHELKGAEIFATDVSRAALAVALRNAERLQANISLIEHNVLRENLPVTNLDVIVSNPPYITEQEKEKMEPKVLNHEPHVALFVPDDDPLLFYKSIAAQAAKALKPSGMLAVEVNQKFGNGVSLLFQQAGLQEIRIINDLAGKPRIVTGTRSASEM